MVSVFCLQEKQTNQPNKKTNKTVTELDKKSFKKQLKNTFYLIKIF